MYYPLEIKNCRICFSQNFHFCRISILNSQLQTLYCMCTLQMAADLQTPWTLNTVNILVHTACTVQCETGRHPPQSTVSPSFSCRLSPLRMWSLPYLVLSSGGSMCCLACPWPISCDGSSSSLVWCLSLCPCTMFGSITAARRGRCVVVGWEVGGGWWEGVDVRVINVDLKWVTVRFWACVVC